MHLTPQPDKRSQNNVLHGNPNGRSDRAQCMQKVPLECTISPINGDFCQNECNVSLPITTNSPLDKNHRSQLSVSEPVHNSLTQSIQQTLDNSNDKNDIINTLSKSLQAITAVNHDTKQKFSAINIVPEFDPKIKNQTITTWINKVNECAEIYSWDGKQTAHYALPKLMGTAKRWYEGQSSVMYPWDVWQTKLKSAFPTYENYGHLLTEMLNIKAKFGDSLEEYYYEKLIALNRCHVTGKDAIDCILYGIEDRSVRYGAEAVGFEDNDKLLGFLRNVKHERVDKVSRKVMRPLNDLMRKPQRTDPGRVIRCFNCHEVGHLVLNCTKPIRKCQKCMRVGHDDPGCTREVWKARSDIKTL